MNDVTQILGKIESGDQKAVEELLPLVYDELRMLAAKRLRNEKPGQTLQATALVHEAYLRMVDTDKVQQWDSRGHFFVAAAEAMRRILVDNARRKSRAKHGGDHNRVGFEPDQAVGGSSPDELLRIHEALSRLGTDDEVAANVVKLCYFGGLAVEESGDVLGISRGTAYRHWTYAKAWLHADIKRAD